MSSRLAAPVTIVSHALLPQADSPWQAALPHGQHPAVRALARANVLQRNAQNFDSHHASHEQAYAQAVGWSATEGLLPFAAQAALQQSLSCPSAHGWAFVDLVHWHVNQGQVHLDDAGTISRNEDQALLQSMAPYFKEDDIHLHAYQAGRWLAHSPHFKQLPSVSLDQVMGRQIAHWLQSDEVAQQPKALRLLRRLQNEMQMLLYTHPINETRRVSLNSFWWSGTGDLPLINTAQVSLNTSLRPAFLAQDPLTWGQQWQHLAEEVMLPALKQGHTLVLCGELRSLHLQASPQTTWQRLKNLLPAQALHKVLA